MCVCVWGGVLGDNRNKCFFLQGLYLSSIDIEFYIYGQKKACGANSVAEPHDLNVS
jgi:hypothetical protein